MLYYNTVNTLLHDSLKKLMQANELSAFRLVGGTSLSLQIGHRISVDIDLFTDAMYGSIDFAKIEKTLKSLFVYVDYFSLNNPSIGMSFSVGHDRDNAIKLDIYYTEPFVQKAIVVDEIRMATIEEIIAMKIDIIQRGGRKKDFWDIHELLTKYPIEKMLQLHEEKYQYSHDRNTIIQNFTNFSTADDDLDPVCLRGKYWEFIKEDIEIAIENFGRK